MVTNTCNRVGQIKQSILVEVQVGMRQPHVQYCNEETKDEMKGEEREAGIEKHK